MIFFEAVLGEAYMTEIETRHQIMLQGTSHPLTSNMDSQDIPIDLTGSTPFHPHILSADSDDSFKSNDSTNN